LYRLIKSSLDLRVTLDFEAKKRKFPAFPSELEPKTFSTVVGN
jgi:hypothetical protein